MVLILLIPVAIALASLFGFFVSLLSRLPALQYRAIGDSGYRRILTLFLAFIAFIIVYSALTYIYADTQADIVNVRIASDLPDEWLSRRGLQNEIWLRTMLMSSGCFHDNLLVCEAVSVYLSDKSVKGFRWFIVAIPFALIGVWSGVWAAAFTRQFTRYSSKSKRDSESKRGIHND